MLATCSLPQQDVLPFQKEVLEKIGLLFGLKTLSAHIGHLHEYSIFTDPQDARCAQSEFAVHRIITQFVSEHCTTWCQLCAES